MISLVSRSCLEMGRASLQNKFNNVKGIAVLGDGGTFLNSMLRMTYPRPSVITRKIFININAIIPFF